MKIHQRLLVIVGLIAILSMSGVAAKEASVAYLLDGYQKNCTIQRGKQVFKATNITRDLFNGDIIYKTDGVDETKLKIRYYPEAVGVKINSTTLEIRFTPKRDKKSLLEILADILGFHKTQHKDNYNVSLSEEDFKYYNLLSSENQPTIQPKDNAELEEIIMTGLEKVALSETDVIERGIQQAIFVMSLMRYYPEESSYLYARGYQLLCETKELYKREMSDQQKSFISWILKEYRFEE